MSVEAGPQPLLVEEVSDETDASAEDEKTIENTHFKVVLGLFIGESTAIAHKVNKADGNAAVDVQNQVVLLRCCHSLDGKSIVEHLGAREVGLNIVFNKLDTKIGVVSGLDPVADTGD